MTYNLGKGKNKNKGRKDCASFKRYKGLIIISEPSVNIPSKNKIDCLEMTHNASSSSKTFWAETTFGFLQPLFGYFE